MTDRRRKVLAVLAEIASFLLAGGLAVVTGYHLSSPQHPPLWLLAATGLGLPLAVGLNWVAGKLGGYCD